MSAFNQDDPIAGRPHVGFLLAVAGPALLTALGFGVLSDIDATDISLLAPTFLFAFFIASVIIALAAVLIGLPLTWLLGEWRMETPWSYPLAGFIAGAALIVLTAALFGEAPLEYLPYAWIGALPGAVSGAIWWWAYRRHVREAADRDQ